MNRAAGGQTGSDGLACQAEVLPLVRPDGDAAQ